MVLCGPAIAEPENEFKQRTRTAPRRNLESSIIDGAGAESGFDGSKDGLDGLDERKGRSGRVSVTTVAWFTLAMAAATGLGAIPFFFVELEPQWAGVCNGMAAGVMLAASFDLVQEGQTYGSGNWVVTGILSGGIFIWLCKKVMKSINFIVFLFLII